MPRDPDVFGQPVSPKSASTSRATSATSTICGQLDAGNGVEIDAQFVRDDPGRRRGSDAGSGRCSRGWPPRPVRRRPRSTISSAVRPDGKLSTTVSSQSGRFAGARFWKNASPSAPCTKRLSTIGRPADAAQGAVGDAEVVADQVQLGVPGPREVDLVRVGDRHRAAGDLDDLLALGHAATITGGGPLAMARPLIGRALSRASPAPAAELAGPTACFRGCPRERESASIVCHERAIAVMDRRWPVSRR